MSTVAGPDVVRNGLIVELDSLNRNSFVGVAGNQASILNTSTWTIGPGGTGGYSQNGNTAENQRIVDTDPWGNQSVVWGTYASGDGGADGGWNSDFFNIDNTKLYRFSVWVRRTSSTGSGTFYFGTGAGGADVVRTDNSTTQGNAYWECEGSGALTQNQWYLVCGHIYPYGTTYTGRHPNTGFFTIDGGTSKVRDVNGCNIGQDLKWDAGSVSSYHRVYHYYCGDATTRLQFAFPRVDIVDGNEPSIYELLNNGESQWKDVSGNNNHFAIQGNVTLSRSNGFTGFDGNGNAVGNRIIKNAFPTNLKASQGGTGYTIMALAKSTAPASVWRKLIGNADGDNYIDLYQSTSGGWHQDGSGENLFHNDGIADANDALSISDGVWRVLWASNLNSGVLTNPTQGLSIGNEPTSNAYPWIGNIALVLIYNRVLTANEMIKNFYAFNGRVGI